MSCTCQYSWCEEVRDDHTEHTWHAEVNGSRDRFASVYASVHDGFSERILIGAGIRDDAEDGTEVWLTLEQARQFRDALTQAIENADTAP